MPTESKRQEKRVKLWKVWNKFDDKVREYRWVVESFDAIEQPSRYKVDGREYAFGFKSYVDKKYAYLTREAAVAAKIAECERRLERAKQAVIDDAEELALVRAL